MSETKEIMIRSKFGGWVKISKEAALDHARWKIHAITAIATNEDKLKLINSNLKGISFTLEDLL